MKICRLCPFFHLCPFSPLLFCRGERLLKNIETCCPYPTAPPPYPLLSYNQCVPFIRRSDHVRLLDFLPPSSPYTSTRCIC